MARTWLIRGGVAALLLIAAGVAVFAYGAMMGALNPGSSTGQNETPQPGSCSPGPCLAVQGYTLWVSNVTVEGNLVRMSVRFKNSSNATHASPEDLTLIDASNHTSRIVTDAADCNTWPRHEFANGATFGPIDICFHVTTTSPRMTLRWTPDLGFFCCDESLALVPESAAVTLSPSS